MPTVAINGADIYYQTRGSGPPLLFICGAFADVDHFARVADILSDEFTVVTYDRRGNSRSTGINPGVATSPSEQADDAATLLRTLSLAPAAVYGNSSGAIMALALVLEHPEVVSAAMFHEPPLNEGMEDAAAVGEFLQNVIGDGMAAGGPPAAAETFLRFAMGDTNWDTIGPESRERARNNATVFFGSEIGNFEPFAPTPSQLKDVRIPTEVLVSDDGPPFFKEIAPWLANQLGTSVATVPGTHTPQIDHPHELADHIRAFLAAR